MISKFPPAWNFTLRWNAHKDQMISKKLQRLHCETALTLIAKRPLSGRSFVDQHVMLFYHLRQVTLILKVLVSEC